VNYKSSSSSKSFKDSYLSFGADISLSDGLFVSTGYYSSKYESEYNSSGTTSSGDDYTYSNTYTSNYTNIMAEIVKADPNSGTRMMGFIGKRTKNKENKWGWKYPAYPSFNPSYSATVSHSFMTLGVHGNKEFGGFRAGIKATLPSSSKETRSDSDISREGNGLSLKAGFGVEEKDFAVEFTLLSAAENQDAAARSRSGYGLIGEKLFDSFSLAGSYDIVDYKEMKITDGSSTNTYYPMNRSKLDIEGIFVLTDDVVFVASYITSTYSYDDRSSSTGMEYSGVSLQVTSSF